jgi:hypothetical protein
MTNEENEQSTPEIESPKSAQGEAQTKSNVKNPLRKKHQLFINYYTDIGKDYFGNGSQCAILAGFSPKTSRSIASELLARPYIKDAIEKKELERAKAFDWDFERWTRELIAIFEALTPTNPQKLKAIELIGKSKGFIKDNQIQLNTINVIGDQDIAKIREGIAGRFTKRLSGQAVDNIGDKLLTSTPSGDA